MNLSDPAFEVVVKVSTVCNVSVAQRRFCFGVRFRELSFVKTGYEGVPAISASEIATAAREMSQLYDSDVTTQCLLRTSMSGAAAS